MLLNFCYIMSIINEISSFHEAIDILFDSFFHHFFIIIFSFRRYCCWMYVRTQVVFFSHHKNQHYTNALDRFNHNEIDRLSVIWWVCEELLFACHIGLDLMDNNNEASLWNIILIILYSDIKLKSPSTSKYHGWHKKNSTRGLLCLIIILFLLDES